jgi:hypothetical protein
MKRTQFCQKVRVLALVVVFSISSVIVTHSTAFAALVINEIMQNPAAVSDTFGEWFEIYNDSGSAIDIDGWTIKDDDADSHTISGTLLVPANSYFVMGKNSDFETNGGVTLDYTYSGITLANSADELELLDNDSDRVDYVAWASGSTWPDVNGASMELLDWSLDNNIGSNWYAATTPWSGGDGDYGSPGAVNGPVPIPGAVWLLGSGLVGLGVFRRKVKT